MLLHQQTPTCADFDITLEHDGDPAFRLLLPEHVYTSDNDSMGHVHTIPGTWERHFGLTGGRFVIGHTLEIAALLMPAENAVRVSLTFQNISDVSMNNVQAEICASLSHLPGEPSWCNRTFFDTQPLDRSEQGRLWYDEIAPDRLEALTLAGNWIGMHPGTQGSDEGDKGFTPSEEATAQACAVESPVHGGEQFFQAWDVASHWVTPAPENACMHLRPVVAETLAPGESATIHGVAGIFTGEREALMRHILVLLG
jgi:hypothetical protein